MDISCVPEHLKCPICFDYYNDPVVSPDGRSFCRKCIEEWIRGGHHSSPMSRMVINLKDLKPNISLRECVDAHLMDSVKPVQQTQDISEIVIPKIKSELSDVLYISIEAPEIEKPINSDVILLLDVSKSMGLEVTTPDDKRASGESVNFSRLDLAIHTVKAIILGLPENSRLSVITFSNTASIIFKMMVMDANGRKDALNAIERISYYKTTNIWDGLIIALELVKSEANPNHNIGIFLLTDGVPNIRPPMGCIEAQALSTYIKKMTQICSVNVFGFGYQLESRGLKELASVGNGFFVFIPDYLFVGTCVTNAIANFLSIVTNKIILKIDLSGPELPSFDECQIYRCLDKNKQSLAIDVGFLLSGQTKNIIIPIKNATPGSIAIINTTCFTTSTSQTFALTPLMTQLVSEFKPMYELDDPDYVQYHVFRSKVINVIHSILENNYSRSTQCDDHWTIDERHEDNFEKSERIYELIQMIQSSSISSNPLVVDLLHDLMTQVVVGLDRSDYYKQWGRHYLRSFIMAHTLEIRNNFKDKSVQNYTGILISTIHEQLNDLFNGISAPVSTMRTHLNPQNSGSQIQPVDMSNINNSNNACYLGDCTIRMSDGSKQKVKNIRRGDVVMTPLGSSKVKFVVKSMNPVSTFEMIKFGPKYNNLVITPWHPIQIRNVWKFPNDIDDDNDKQKILIMTEGIYSLILEQYHVVYVNDIISITLGHGYINDVIKHEYFGTQRIVQDIEKIDSEDQSNGFVIVHNTNFRRDPVTSEICEIRK